MKRKFVLIAGLATIAFLASLPVSPAMAETMYVRTATARLRATESPLAVIVQILKRGSEVEVLSRKGRFARVKTKQDKEGWIYLRRLTDAKPGGESGIFSSLGQAFRGTDASETAASAAARGVEEEKGASGAGGGARSSIQKVNLFGAEMEKYRPTDDQLDRFLREGKLGEYAE